MTQGADTQRRDDGDPPFSEPVQFRQRGYGATCSLCGSLVVGSDGEATHRRHHRAMAAWWHPGTP